RLRNLADLALLVPTATRVARHVAEQQVLPRRVPDRSFREGEAGADLLDLGVRVDQLVELIGLGLDTHPRLLSARLARRTYHGVPALDAAEDLAQAFEAGDVVAGEEAVDVGQGGAHPGGERLVLRPSLQRVDPDDGERLPSEPCHLPLQ